MLEKKILLIICDGLADRPCPELGGKTPLQYASTPSLDRMAEKGMVGLMDPIAPGVRPGSDTSHLSILGYDPKEMYSGRGPFEAAGVGIELKKGDVAFRCNFATVDEKLTVLDRRAGRIREGTSLLSSALNEIQLSGAELIFKEGTDHRAALVLRGEGLSQMVTDVDPHSTGTKILESKPMVPEAKKTAALLNQFVKESYRLLKDHEVNIERVREGKMPANIVLPRGAGIHMDIPSFKERYGLKSAAVVAVSLIKGICRTLDIEVLRGDGWTGGVDTDMGSKAIAAVKAMDSNDFVFLHIKAPDVASHDRSASTKVSVIERIDEMVGKMEPALPKESIVAITADHTTPLEVGDHTADPVPIMIFGDGVRVDSVTQFNEVSAAQGLLGRIRGLDLLPILLDLANRVGKYGA